MSTQLMLGHPQSFTLKAKNGASPPDYVALPAVPTVQTNPSTFASTTVDEAGNVVITPLAVGNASALFTCGGLSLSVPLTVVIDPSVAQSLELVPA